MYQPKHAARRAVRAWMVAAAVAFSGSVTGGLVAATASSASAATTGGVTTEIVLANGGYRQCLNDWGQITVPGARVTLYACGTGQAANQWVTFPDSTIRPSLNTAMALTVNGSNQTVLEPATGATAQNWYYRDDGALVSGLTNAVGVSYLLNDPGYNAANGVQQIIWNEANWQAPTTNAHWWVTKARFASSTLSDRPDSGGNGNWANDHLARGAMVLYMGDITPGTHTYQGDVRDVGTFSALAGAFAPNQGQFPGSKVANSVTGPAVGGTGYSFTSDQFVSRFPASAYSGGTPTTGSWPSLFYASTATIGGPGIMNSGPVQWSWKYNYKTQQWIDAAFNNGGQFDGSGNITG